MDTNLDMTKLPAMQFAGRDVARYKRLHDELERLTKTLEQVEQVIKVITAGSPDNVRVLTATRLEDEYTAPTRVYQLQDGAWRRCGSIVIERHESPFYGTGGFVTSDSELVITDHQSGFGISVGQKIEWIDLSDPAEESRMRIGAHGSHDGTLYMLRQVKPGETTRFRP